MLFLFRLPAPVRIPQHVQSKAEILLGYTIKQMSYQKALEVLGVSEAVVEEERAKRLGELGLSSLSTGGNGGGPEMGVPEVNDDSCGGFFIKRGRSSSSHDEVSMGASVPGEVALGSTRVSFRCWS